MRTHNFDPAPRRNIFYIYSPLYSSHSRHGKLYHDRIALLPLRTFLYNFATSFVVLRGPLAARIQEAN